MKTNQTYLALDACNWPTMIQQVEAAINACWHQYAGQWQPENISLHVSDRLLPDGMNKAQREVHLPVLVAWLRRQGHVVTVFSDRNLIAHRLYINNPAQL